MELLNKQIEFNLDKKKWVNHYNYGGNHDLFLFTRRNIDDTVLFRSLISIDTCVKNEMVQKYDPWLWEIIKGLVPSR